MSDTDGNHKRPRWGRILRKACLFLGGCVAAIAALEFGLWFLAVTMVARSVGVDRAAEGEAFTIFCIGDSWTQGAPDGTYPQLLADKLNARSGEHDFRAVNFGLGGTNSSQAMLRLTGAVSEARPDLIIVLTGNNDHWNLKSSAYWKFANRELGPASIMAARARIFVNSLRTYRLARTAWQYVAGKPTANEFFDLEMEGDVLERAGLIAIDREIHNRQLRYNLTQLVELSSAERIPIVFMTYFHFHGYRVNEIIRDVASDYGIPLVDHNFSFHVRIAVDEREGFLIADGHPNPNGYDFMADSIVEMLDQHALVPASSKAAARLAGP